MKQALGYVYSFPISTAIVGISTVDELEENISITHAFSPLEDTEKKEIEQLTAHYYEDASWYKYQW
jgi:uncharacterized protein